MQINFLCFLPPFFSYPRSVTVPFVAGEGWGFEVTGGNAVGIFISKVSSNRKELQVREIDKFILHYRYMDTYVIT